jgi:hypothetical protein
MRTRTLIAVLTAPVAGVLLAWGILRLLAGSPGPGWLGFFLLFAVPVAYLLEAAVGIPLYRWMRRRNGVRALPVILSATAAGILAVLVPFAFIAEGLTAETLGLSFLFGGIGGLATGAWFWLVSGWGRPAPAA